MAENGTLECANEGSRFPSWLGPSHINWLPKISPSPCLHTSFSASAHSPNTHQSSLLSVQGVAGVEELWAAFGVRRDFLLVPEPLVLRFRETVVLHAVQLCRFAHWHRLGYCASGHYGLHYVSHKRSHLNILAQTMLEHPCTHVPLFLTASILAN